MNTRKIICASALLLCGFGLSGCQTQSPPPVTSSPTVSDSAPESSTTPKTSEPPNSSSSQTSESGQAGEYKPATPEHPAENVPLPKMPAQAKKNSAAGAEAFATYYFDLINYVIETNDTELMKEASSRSCQICGNGFIDPADYAESAGEWIDGGHHKATVLDVNYPSKKTATVTFRYQSDVAQIYNQSRELVYEIEPVDSDIITLSLKFDKHWLVTDIIR